MKVNRVVEKLLAIGELGVENTSVQSEKRRIRITNYASMIGIFSILFYTTYDLISFRALSVDLIQSWFFIFILLGPLYFNFKKKNNLAKIVLCSSLFLTIFISAYVCNRIAEGVQYYFLLFAITPSLFWSSKQRIYIIFFFLLNLISFIYLEYYAIDSMILFNQLQHTQIKIYRIATISTTFLTFLFILKIFQKEVTQNENLLEVQSNDLQTINEELRQQKEEVLQLVNEIETQRNNIEYINFKLLNQHAEISNQRDKLLTLNGTKDKFFTIIAHDLRSPFLGILGITELLTKHRNEFGEEQLAEFHSTLYDSANATFRLLGNLLDWAKSQRGIIEFNPEPINVRKLFDEKVTALTDMAIQKDISLDIQMPEGLILEADSNMFQSIIRNLITNAIKFTKEKGTVRVIATQDESYTTFRIIDNGVGISDETLKKLFRIDIHHTDMGTNFERGTGLGLLLCKEFIEKHGGEIKIISELGKGSEFMFTIPNLI